jgi:hypothetical protein
MDTRVVLDTEDRYCIHLDTRGEVLFCRLFKEICPYECVEGKFDLKSAEEECIDYSLIGGVENGTTS